MTSKTRIPIPSFITEFILAEGSHPFPSPDGRVCINEAAIVAAGLPYREIRSAEDCPLWFSRPLAVYALGLNDAMPDCERQSLMAFVLRLSGSADSPEIEAERARYIVLETVRRILPPALRAAGYVNEADRCAQAADLAEAQIAVEEAMLTALRSPRIRLALRITRDAAKSADSTSSAWTMAEVAELASTAAPIWPVAVAILDEALRIGRQAPVADPALAQERLDRARAFASTGREAAL